MNQKHPWKSAIFSQVEVGSLQLNKINKIALLHSLFYCFLLIRTITCLLQNELEHPYDIA